MIRTVVFDIYNVLIDEANGPIHESVDLLMELKSRGVPLYAVTNMSGHGFDSALQAYPFLRQFDGVVVSGKIGLTKPDPAIFRHLLETYNLTGSETLFIDDALSNVESARIAGLQAVQFQNPRQLERELFARKVLNSADYASQNHCGQGCTCHHH